MDVLFGTHNLCGSIIRIGTVPAEYQCIVQRAILLDQIN